MTKLSALPVAIHKSPQTTIEEQKRRHHSIAHALVALALALGSTELMQPVAAVTLPESIPDFSQDTSRPSVTSVASGSWSSASTWQGGQIPTANHVVRIAAGHTVTIADTAAVAYTIAVDGKLAFATTVNTRLKVTNLQVMAGEMGMGTPGVLEIGTAAAPIAAGVTAEIVIANSPLGGSVSDPEQFGTGLMVLGRMTVHGAPRTPTFTRLASEPRAGNTTLTLSEAVSGWRPGDRIVLPDTRHIKASESSSNPWINAVNQWEERTVSAISADGRTVTLTSALTYDHLGARDLNGALDFLPHAGNLTRNVVIRSESASGTRGHTIVTHMADADIRYALFKDLGRTTYLPLNTTTNHIGRYPIHMHHLAGPATTPANGFQFTLVGNAVDGGSIETKFKWGIAVHGSHYGSIQDNVVYNYNGASIATEDGSESFNVFDHNFALRGMGEPNDSVSQARMALGTEGVGFWFRGPNNYVRNNVAANFQNPTTEAAYGFVYQFLYLGDIAVPNVKGAMSPSQFTTRNGNNMPLLQFEDNEAYGAMQGGFTFWWIGSQDPRPFTGQAESVVKNLKLWHIFNKTVYVYPSQRITFDGLKIRGNFTSASQCCGNGVFFADYSVKGIIIRNADIQGVEEGITAPEAGFGPEPNLTIESSYLRNNANIVVPTVGSVNGCWMDNKLVVISNTRVEAPPGRSLSGISMVRDVANAPECLGKLNEVKVYAYNGAATDNFQVYHSNTSVLPRPPSSCTPVTRAGINGPTCPIPAQNGKQTPVITWNNPASIVYGTALSGTQLNATTTVPGTFAYSPPAGSVLSAGAGQTLSVTFTPNDTATYNAASRTVSITVLKATPVITWANPADITQGTPLSSTQLNATTSVAGAFAYSPPAGTVLGVGAGQQLSTTFTPSSTANYNTATKTVLINVNGTPTTGHNAARANSYDDAWQDGASGWVANAKAILAGGTGEPGLVLWIGDSLTRDPALGAWAQNGAGKTASDDAITAWMHAGLSPQGIDSIDGFALATPYFCPARSFTVGDGLGAWDFMGTSSMPADSNPTSARQKLLDCATYPNALNLTTMLAALPKAQFAIPEVNLDAARPEVFTDLERMIDMMIANHIVPIIITYSYRTDANFNALVDRYNAALVQYAQNKKLPLIDFNKEMLARLPFSQWPGRFLADGVHYTHGNAQFPATSDPYAAGGDPATHTTGDALTFDGYGLKGWLGVQKMKEIKALVIDGTPPAPPPPPPPGDTTPPTVTSTAPVNAATAVTTATTVRATFSEAMTAASVTSTTFQLRTPANAVVAATVSYNASTNVATLTPAQLLAGSTTYTATITGGSAGVKDAAGNPLASNVVWSFTTAAQAPRTIFSPTSAPTTFATGDGSSVELGVKFRADVDGVVTGVRFYKGTTTTGTHTGTLWSSTGTMLASATFSGETASGWQQVSFSTPVAITANTVYVVSYHTSVGRYAYTYNTFVNAGVDNGPLHALRAGVSGGNGVFRYGGVAFPTQSFNSSNYWVDVVFVPR